MLEIERQEHILKKLLENGKLTYEELEGFLDVSIATIRRDVDKLYKMGKLSKVTGGIVLKKKMNLDLNISERFSENTDEKILIGKKASTLIMAEDFIFIDAGTTTFNMIDDIPSDVTVVTNGLMHIEKLIEKRIKTILIGGEIKFSTNVVCGASSVRDLEKYRFDKAFLGANGVDINFGFTTPDINEAVIKETVINLSSISYVLADSSKFGNYSNIKFADIEKCKIITGKNHDESYEKYIEK